MIREFPKKEASAPLLLWPDTTSITKALVTGVWAKRSGRENAASRQAADRGGAQARGEDWGLAAPFLVCSARKTLRSAHQQRPKDRDAVG